MDITRIDSITELHELLGCTKPQHPLVSVVHESEIKFSDQLRNKKIVLNFNIIVLKTKVGSFKYGSNHYDFSEGTLIFMASNQAITTSIESNSLSKSSGWNLFFHPDLLRNSRYSGMLKQYSFFSYATNEALHLSEEEKQTIDDCVQKIEKEYKQSIDKHTQNVILSNIELLLNYCERFYDRQFITRSPQNKDIITRFEEFLTTYYTSNSQRNWALPSVSKCAEALNLSPNYLSDLLKKETGKNTQEHIHYFVIDLAKNRLLSTKDTVNEIAYSLGFEYPSYFTKIFKSKTNMTPIEYRKLN